MSALIYKNINLVFMGLKADKTIKYFIISGTKNKTGHRHRSKAHSTFKSFCQKKNIHEKLTKCPNFTWFLPEKLAKYLFIMNVLHTAVCVCQCVLFSIQWELSHWIVLHFHDVWQRRTSALDLVSSARRLVCLFLPCKLTEVCCIADISSGSSVHTVVQWETQLLKSHEAR